MGILDCEVFLAICPRALFFICRQEREVYFMSTCKVTGLTGECYITHSEPLCPNYWEHLNSTEASKPARQQSRSSSTQVSSVRWATQSKVPICSFIQPFSGCKIFIYINYTGPKCTDLSFIYFQLLPTIFYKSFLFFATNYYSHLNFLESKYQQCFKIR